MTLVSSGQPSVLHPSFLKHENSDGAHPQFYSYTHACLYEYIVDVACVICTCILLLSFGVPLDVL